MQGNKLRLRISASCNPIVVCYPICYCIRLLLYPLQLYAVVCGSPDKKANALTHDAKPGKQRPRLASIGSVKPEWRTPHILGSYRFGHGLRDSLLSVFSLHNQTLNVWTHFIGVVWFFVLTLQAISGECRY